MRDQFGIHNSNLLNNILKNNRDINKPEKPMFETALVVDFVSNPRKFLEKRAKIPESSFSKRSIVNAASPESKKEIKNIDLYQGGLRVRDPSLLEIMPQNSIIGYTVSDPNPEYTVLFPFYPSHLSLPVKPGEKVWYFYDRSMGKKVGYWLHRKTGTRFTEDVNYTDDTRQTILSALGLGVAVDEKGEEEYKKVLHSFLDDLSPEKGHFDPNFAINKIHSFSTSYVDFKGAVTPPSYKKCSDLTLQGSNNTKIVMTSSDISNTGEIRIVSGYKRDFQHKKIKNVRPLKMKLDGFEYEEYDKFQGVLRKKFLEFDSTAADAIIPKEVPLTTVFSDVKDLLPKIELPPIPPGLSSLNIPLPNLEIPNPFDYMNIPNPRENIPKINTEGMTRIPVGGIDPVFSEDLNRDGLYKITEPAAICVREYQSDQSFLENVDYDKREGFGLPVSTDIHVGNIILKTNASNELLTKKPRSAQIDMLGNKISIKTSNSSFQNFESDGNIVLYAPSQPANIGPHVMLGGTNLLETTPIVKTDNLTLMLNELLVAVGASIAPPPGSPLLTAAGGALSLSLATIGAKYLTPGLPTYIGSNTSRVK